MPATTIYKILGQYASSGTTANDVYAVSSGKQGIVSTITVCNTTASALTFSIAVRPSADSAVAAKHYITNTAPIPAYSTISYTLGITMSAGDKVNVAASATGVSFSLFGTEVSA